MLPQLLSKLFPGPVRNLFCYIYLVPIFYQLKKETALHVKSTKAQVWKNSQVSLHNRHIMSQARRKRHLVRGAKRVRTAFRTSRVCKFADWFSSVFQSLQTTAYSAISPTLARVKTNQEMMIFTDKKLPKCSYSGPRHF